MALAMALALVLWMFWLVLAIIPMPCVWICAEDRAIGTIDKMETPCIIGCFQSPNARKKRRKTRSERGRFCAWVRGRGHGGESPTWVVVGFVDGKSGRLRARMRVPGK